MSDDVAKAWAECPSKFDGVITWKGQHFPEPAVAIGRDEFERLLLVRGNMHGIEAVGYSCLWLPGQPKDYLPMWVRFFWLGGPNGFGLATTAVRWGAGRELEADLAGDVARGADNALDWIVPEGPTYATRIRAWVVGCRHPNTQETRRSMHVHHYKCADCGAEWEFDSSD